MLLGKHSCLPLVVRICAGVRRDEDVVRFGQRSYFRGLALLSGNGATGNFGKDAFSERGSKSCIALVPKQFSHLSLLGDCQV